MTDDQTDPVSWNNRHRIYPSGYCDTCRNNPCLGDKMDKYPAHEELKTLKPYDKVPDRWGAGDYLEEFQSILAARQRDEEMIRGLVEVLELAKADVPEWYDPHLKNPDYIKIETAINAAELRLKEGV